MATVTTLTAAVLTALYGNRRSPATMRCRNRRHRDSPRASVQDLPISITATGATLDQEESTTSPASHIRWRREFHRQGPFGGVNAPRSSFVD